MPSFSRLVYDESSLIIDQVVGPDISGSWTAAVRTGNAMGGGGPCSVQVRVNTIAHVFTAFSTLDDIDVGRAQPFKCETVRFA